MTDYIIMTDSSCDFTAEMIKELDLCVIPLTVTFDQKSYRNSPDGKELDIEYFYKRLREGTDAKTSAANVDDFKNEMEPILKEGKDILYLGFSSALSGTCNAGSIAAREMMEQYPGRKVYVVDTLCASLGEGMFVYLCCKEAAKGKTIEEVRDYAEANKLHLCHWFTVDDLYFLRRGGRVTGAAAFIGSMLHIKPVMHVDNEGRLIPMEKMRGRKAALTRLIQKMQENAIEPENQTIFISHGDCIEEAKELAQKIKDTMGVKEVFINHVGPVIGSHSGPGTMALFFIGKER